MLKSGLVNHPGRYPVELRPIVLTRAANLRVLPDAAAPIQLVQDEDQPLRTSCCKFILPFLLYIYSITAICYNAVLQ